MDKEKEIEELRQVIAEYSCNRQCTESCERRGFCCIKRFVTNIIDAGYRKVTEGAVVLTKEEYSDYLMLQKDFENLKDIAERLKADNERLYKNLAKFKDEVRKETAEKILTRWYKKAMFNFRINEADFVISIGKEYGVEVQK